MKNAIIILVLSTVSASANAQSIWGTFHDIRRTVQDVNGTAREVKNVADQFKPATTTKKTEPQGTPAAHQQATAQSAPAAVPAAATRTVISLEKCDFGLFRNLINSLKVNPALTVAEQSFNEAGVSTITILHTMSEYDLFDIADAQMPGRLAPKRMDKHAIVLAIKS